MRLIQWLMDRAREAGERGAVQMQAMLQGAVVALILAYVLLQFVLSFVPEVEAAIDGTTITDPFTLAILGIAKFMFGVGPVVAVVLGLLGLIAYSKKRGARG